MKAKNYTDLKIWQKAIQLSLHIYKVTENFPKREHFGLAAQIRKSAVSIASNIAEGSARHSNKEFRQFLIVARGSLAELHTQLIIADGNRYLEQGELDILQEEMNEIGRMLHGLKQSLEPAKSTHQLIDS